MQNERKGSKTDSKFESKLSNSRISAVRNNAGIVSRACDVQGDKKKINRVKNSNRYKNNKINRSSPNPVKKIRKRKKIRRVIRKLIRLFLAVSVFALTVVFIIFIAGHFLKGHSNKSTKAEAGNTSKKPPDNEEKKMIMPEKIKEFSEMYHVGDSKYTEFTVCIDAGHGGDDSGAESLDGRYEKDQNLLLAKLVKEYVESVGIHVVMTRQSDKTVSLDARKDIAERSDADLLISLHRNVYEWDKDINGIEAWINNSEDDTDIRVAERILKSIEDNISGVNNRGVKSGSMDNASENYSINEISIPSMIIEVGFISSEHDNQLFDKYTEDFAIAVARGIIESVEDIR